jgi:hypothetical protein
MPSSKLKVEVAHILKDEGYISNFKVSEEGKKKVLRIVLRYGVDGENVITTIDRVSRPGRRVYHYPSWSDDRKTSSSSRHRWRDSLHRILVPLCLFCGVA